jgi:hypothetical protein
MVGRLRFAAFLAPLLVVAAVVPASARGRGSITRLAGGSGVAAQAHSYDRPSGHPSKGRSAPPSSHPEATQTGVTGGSGYAPPPVYTRSCAATHTISGQVVASAPSQDCLLASLAPPVEEDDERGNRRRRARRPSPEELARIAADRAISLAPKPRLRLTPRAVGLTGLRSYFWLARRPRPITASAGVPGLTVTAQARPVQYVWGFGDGVEKVTRNSGRRWRSKRPGNIGHVYETRGRYRTTVEVIWEARWRIGGGGWRPLGFFSNSDSRRYRVRQVVAVLVRPR